MGLLASNGRVEEGEILFDGETFLRRTRRTGKKNGL